VFNTKNDLPEETRAKTVELLNARLADCIDLQTQCKQAHWNVKGPTFIALHELFDQVNEAVEDYVDDIAERAVQLGGVAQGTARMVAQRSSLAEYPKGKAARHAIDQSNDLGDLDTADLFTEASRDIDKWLWFVEAHLQAER
jgi:starvation-inducible DNA-binding protein